MGKYFSRWYIYLTSILFIVVAFCIGVSFKVTPSKEQKIEIFLGATQCDTVSLIETLNNNKPEDVVTVNLNFHYSTHSNFSYIFTSFRAEMDIFILPEKYIKDFNDTVSGYSANIKKDEFEQYLGITPTYFMKDQFYKGIKVYDSETKEGILKDKITYCDDQYSSDYYLFFNYNSVNIDFLNNNSVTDNALKLVRAIFNENL